MVYSRLNGDRSNLVEQQRQDSSIQPPFFWHHMRPERRRAAIIETWQQARPGTVARRLFDAGATAGEHAPNWVTLWLLYSVFRSRDVRNNRNRRAEGSNGGNGKASCTGFGEGLLTCGVQAVTVAKVIVGCTILPEIRIDRGEGLGSTVSTTTVLVLLLAASICL